MSGLPRKSRVSSDELPHAKLPLTWLNYSYCLNITDAGVTHVATKCAKHSPSTPAKHSIRGPIRNTDPGT